jgi:hypothetical protein
MTSDEMREEMGHPQGDLRDTGVRPQDEPAAEVPEGEEDVRRMTTDERRRENPERLDHMTPPTGPIALNDDEPTIED